MNLIQSILKLLSAWSTSTKPQPIPKPSKNSVTSSPTKPAVKPVPVDLPWMTEMNKVKGLHETRDHAKLVAWLKSDGKTVGDPAKIPWCGDGVQTAIALTLPNEKMPENPWAAISWVKWGKAVTPQYGCVLSFWRGKPSAWQGHVGFYAGEDDNNFYVLGANQADSVSVTKIAKNRLREGGARWPLTGTPPTGKIVRITSNAKPSTNEV